MLEFSSACFLQLNAVYVNCWMLTVPRMLLSQLACCIHLQVCARSEKAVPAQPHWVLSWKKQEVFERGSCSRWTFCLLVKNLEGICLGEKSTYENTDSLFTFTSSFFYKLTNRYVLQVWVRLLHWNLMNRTMMVINALFPLTRKLIIWRNGRPPPVQSENPVQFEIQCSHTKKLLFVSKIKK